MVKLRMKKEPRTHYVAWKALDCRVLVVAVEGYAHDWAAYIGAVEGKNHNEEVEEVARHGSKLSRELAEFLFPQFKDLQYRE